MQPGEHQANGFYYTLDFDLYFIIFLVVQIRFDLLTRGRARSKTAFNPKGGSRTRAQIVSLELVDSELFETYYYLRSIAYFVVF